MTAVPAATPATDRPFAPDASDERGAAPALGGLAPLLAERLLENISRAGHPVGHRLTEQALADELGVSRSPVRKALQVLEAAGALGSHRNRGYFVALDSTGLRQLELPSSTQNDEAVYMRVADEQLRGELPPAVTETLLMQRYGLTRLQVQRVLNRMAREGMVDRKPGRGWVFRTLLSTVDAHRESYRFRMIIEPAALLEPTFRIDRPAIDKVRRDQHALLDRDVQTWTASERFRAGCEFHEVLVACSGNRFLIDALRNVNQLRRLVEYRHHTQSRHDHARLRRQCEEHLALLDLVEAGERIEASHRLRQHLDVVRVVKTGEPGGRVAHPTQALGDHGIEVHL
jgi:DNA-binding GntR family transcriptional regulator